MRFRLTSTDGQHSFEVRPGAPLVVGRAPTSDLPVFDPTISRRHAELACDDDGVALRDLGSSNGTFVNGARVESARLAPNDLVTFGKVAFKLLQVTEPPPSMMPTPAPAVGATIVRQVPVRPGGAPLGGGPATIVAGSPVVRGDEDKTARKLEMLLEVSKGLGRASDIDATLKQIAEYAYQVLDVDRVAILLDDAGQLVSKIARDKRGGDAPRAVPQSIARKVVEEKVAILSDDAGEDTRFTGQSILMQRVRSALCAPLIGSEGIVLGVLYVDNLTTSHRFGEEDLEFLVAFAGIAAVAIENTRFAERIRREMLVRSNFERYFAPSLAERIVASPEAVRLGGEKREVTVLFSDIRGFTALSETMRPDDMASLLTEYFTEMVEIVFRNGGTLDKFIGDAVMAQWGAPIRQDDDADRAMRAAIEMMEALEQLNARWREQGRPELQIGIGLNHGEAFAGNIGSERRLEFTVIGDTVNTASRLCSAAEAREILISDDMRKALTEVPALEECPPMELKGKSQPVPVFKVVA